jgi:hypothetical protein
MGLLISGSLPCAQVLTESLFSSGSAQLTEVIGQKWKRATTSFDRSLANTVIKGGSAI